MLERSFDELPPRRCAIRVPSLGEGVFSPFPLDEIQSASVRHTLNACVPVRGPVSALFEESYTPPL